MEQTDGSQDNVVSGCKIEEASKKQLQKPFQNAE
jgi:hypothetical protein